MFPLLRQGLIYGKGLRPGQQRPHWRGGIQCHLPRKRISTGSRPQYPNPRDTLEAGVGNKSIALKNCRNVILRDFRSSRAAISESS